MIATVAAYIEYSGPLSSLEVLMYSSKLDERSVVVGVLVIDECGDVTHTPFFSYVVTLGVTNEDTT